MNEDGPSVENMGDTADTECERRNTEPFFFLVLPPQNGDILRTIKAVTTLWRLYGNFGYTLITSKENRRVAFEQTRCSCYSRGLRCGD